MAANKFNREDGTFSPIVTGDILGTTTSDNPSSGIIGQIIESEVLVASAISATTGTSLAVASMSLPPGVWDSWGNVCTIVGPTTIMTSMESWISTSSVAPIAPNKGAVAFLAVTRTTGQPEFQVTGQRRFNLTATTSVIMGAVFAFSVSTLGAYGYMAARRI